MILDASNVSGAASAASVASAAGRPGPERVWHGSSDGGGALSYVRLG